MSLLARVRERQAALATAIPAIPATASPRPAPPVAQIAGIAVAAGQGGKTAVPSAWAGALPAEWRDGLARLATMPAQPSLARRWETIVADALALGERWAPQALALGWRDVDLWGCDPDGSRRLDRDGLAMLLNGRTLSAITDATATIATPGGRTLTYYRAPLHGTSLLWVLGSRIEVAADCGPRCSPGVDPQKLFAFETD